MDARPKRCQEKRTRGGDGSMVIHHVDFIALSSYNKGVVSTGAVRLIMDTRSSVTGSSGAG
mgnify:CR=1 FL=1